MDAELCGLQGPSKCRTHALRARDMSAVEHTAMSAIEQFRCSATISSPPDKSVILQACDMSAVQQCDVSAVDKCPCRIC